MNFLSSMFGGGSGAAAQQDSGSSSGQANPLSLLGGDNEVLMTDGMQQAGGKPTTVGQAKIGENKLLALYFSMHNCPPCREFTPLLVELYTETNESAKIMEVVFCSGDQD